MAGKEGRVRLKVYLEEGRRVAEIFVTATTKCRDIVQRLQRQIHSTDCYLLEVWQGCERLVPDNEAILGTLLDWGSDLEDVKFYLHVKEEPAPPQQAININGAINQRVNGFSEEKPIPRDGLLGGNRMSISELRDFAAKQQQEIAAREKELKTKEIQVMELKRKAQNKPRNSYVQQLSAKTEEQHERLKKLRHVQDEVDSYKLDNGALADELENVRSLFLKKEKELAIAVAKVESLTQQLDEQRKGWSHTSPARETTHQQLELERLRKELMMRNELNHQQSVQIQSQKQLLAEKHKELFDLDAQIENHTEDLRKKRNHNNNIDAPSNQENGSVFALDQQEFIEMDYSGLGHFKPKPANGVDPKSANQGAPTRGRTRNSRHLEPLLEVEEEVSDGHASSKSSTEDLSRVTAFKSRFEPKISKEQGKRSNAGDIISRDKKAFIEDFTLSVKMPYGTSSPVQRVEPEGMDSPGSPVLEMFDLDSIGLEGEDGENAYDADDDFLDVSPLEIKPFDRGVGIVKRNDATFKNQSLFKSSRPEPEITSLKNSARPKPEFATLKNRNSARPEPEIATLKYSVRPESKVVALKNESLFKSVRPEPEMEYSPLDVVAPSWDKPSESSNGSAPSSPSSLSSLSSISSNSSAPKAAVFALTGVVKNSPNEHTPGPAVQHGADGGGLYKVESRRVSKPKEAQTFKREFDVSGREINAFQHLKQRQVKTEGSPTRNVSVGPPVRTTLLDFSRTGIKPDFSKNEKTPEVSRTGIKPEKPAVANKPRRNPTSFTSVASTASDYKSTDVGTAESKVKSEVVQLSELPVLSSLLTSVKAEQPHHKGVDEPQPRKVRDETNESPTRKAPLEMTKKVKSVSAGKTNKQESAPIVRSPQLLFDAKSVIRKGKSNSPVTSSDNSKEDRETKLVDGVEGQTSPKVDRLQPALLVSNSISVRGQSSLTKITVTPSATFSSGKPDIPEKRSPVPTSKRSRLMNRGNNPFVYPLVNDLLRNSGPEEGNIHKEVTGKSVNDENLQKKEENFNSLQTSRTNGAEFDSSLSHQHQLYRPRSPETGKKSREGSGRQVVSSVSIQLGGQSRKSLDDKRATSNSLPVEESHMVYPPSENYPESANSAVEDENSSSKIREKDDSNGNLFTFLSSTDKSSRSFRDGKIENQRDTIMIQNGYETFDLTSTGTTSGYSMKSPLGDIGPRTGSVENTGAVSSEYDQPSQSGETLSTITSGSRVENTEALGSEKSGTVQQTSKINSFVPAARPESEVPRFKNMLSVSGASRESGGSLSESDSANFGTCLAKSGSDSEKSGSDSVSSGNSSANSGSSSAKLAKDNTLYSSFRAEQKLLLKRGDKTSPLNVQAEESDNFLVNQREASFEQKGDHRNKLNGVASFGDKEERIRGSFRASKEIQNVPIVIESHQSLQISNTNKGATSKDTILLMDNKMKTTANQADIGVISPAQNVVSDRSDTRSVSLLTESRKSPRNGTCTSAIRADMGVISPAQDVVSDRSDTEPVSLRTESRKSPRNETCTQETEGAAIDESTESVQAPAHKGEEKKKKVRHVSLDPHAVLLDAAVEGELDLVKQVILEVDDPSKPNSDGITALHNAVCASHIDVVRFLVQYGCDINSPDSHGWTPLHCAAATNSAELARFFIEHGACIFATTLLEKKTPLQCCERGLPGFFNCMKYLHDMQQNFGILNDGRVYALYSYTADEVDELSFECGEQLLVLKRGDATEKEWWWAENKNGGTGYIPRNLLGLHPRVSPEV